MAHIVKINTFDKIIHVKDGGSVHRSLLCNISAEISELLERYEEWEAASPWDPDTQDAPQGVLSLLPDSCPLSSKRMVEMWTGFLYGQPMWTFRGKESNKEDFAALIEICDWARACGHAFAVDGALDGICAMLHDHPDVQERPLDMLLTIWVKKGRHRPFTWIIIDFIVLGKDAEKVKAWAFDVDPLRGPVEAETFLLKLELQRQFNDKAYSEGRGEAAPTLIDRCRYHGHNVRPGPCYLGTGDR